MIDEINQRRGFNFEHLVSILLVIGSILGTVIPFQMQTNSRIDSIRVDTNAQLLSYRQESAAQIDAHRQQTAAQIDAIRQDIKDFHGRLCAIEERNRK